MKQKIMKHSCISASATLSRPIVGPVIAPLRGQARSMAGRCLLGLFAAPLLLAALGQEAGGPPGAVPAGQTSSGQFTTRLQSIVNRAGGREPGGRALVVLPSGGDPKLQSELSEDLAVMHHLLDKAIDEVLGSDQRYRKALGVDLVFAPESSPLRQAYLEGYGALFLVRVGFPLLPAASATESPKEDRETNSAWEEARQEILGVSPAVGNGMGAMAEPYSEEKVNHLKSALVNVLKNAANIRGLKPDEGVTICVFGATKSVAAQAGQSIGSRSGDLGLFTRPFGPQQKGTLMTIRAKRSDIEAFSKGQMNVDEFRKNVSIAIYESEEPAEGSLFTGSYYGRGR